MYKSQIYFADVAAFLHSKLIGDNLTLESVCSIDNPRQRSLAFFSGETLEEISSGTLNDCLLLISDNCLVGNKQINFIRTGNPRKSFSDVVREFFTPQERPVISPRALVSPSAHIGEGVSIGNFSIIGDGCEIEDGCFISDFVKISPGVKIGRNSRVGSHTVIGEVGFGFEKHGTEFIRMPHLGNVLIGEEVEIGNHVTIARGTIDSTVISNGVKIDDHVFIAHNVQIGPRTVIIAGSEISGSVRIGKDCWISPQVCVLNKVEIGSNSIVGIGSVVISNVAANNVVVGNPARFLRENNG